jgi:hypothetical protein
MLEGHMYEKDGKTLEDEMIEEYQRTKSVITMEMLKSAFKPMLSAAVEKNRRRDLREQDIQDEAERLFESAINSYARPYASLTSWVELYLKRLDKVLDEKVLEIQAIRLRHRSS